MAQCHTQPFKTGLELFKKVPIFCLCYYLVDALFPVTHRDRHRLEISIMGQLEGYPAQGYGLSDMGYIWGQGLNLRKQKERWHRRRVSLSHFEWCDSGPSLRETIMKEWTAPTSVPLSCSKCH